jgi:hypothetical protein
MVKNKDGVRVVISGAGEEVRHDPLLKIQGFCNVANATAGIPAVRHHPLTLRAQGVLSGA